MFVRNVDFLGKPNCYQSIPHCNWGANDVDGTLLTALRMAYQAKSSVMLIGGLALIHDSDRF